MSAPRVEGNHGSPGVQSAFGHAAIHRRSGQREGVIRGTTTAGGFASAPQGSRRAGEWRPSQRPSVERPARPTSQCVDTRFGQPCHGGRSSGRVGRRRCEPLWNTAAARLDTHLYPNTIARNVIGGSGPRDRSVKAQVSYHPAIKWARGLVRERGWFGRTASPIDATRSAKTTRRSGPRQPAAAAVRHKARPRPSGRRPPHLPGRVP